MKIEVTHNSEHLVVVKARDFKGLLAAAQDHAPCHIVAINPIGPTAYEAILEKKISKKKDE